MVNFNIISFRQDVVDLHNSLVINARRTSYIRGCVFSWGFPLVVVGICVALQMTNTGNVRYGKSLNAHVPYIGKALACQQTLVFDIEFRTQTLLSNFSRRRAIEFTFTNDAHW